MGFCRVLIAALIAWQCVGGSAAAAQLAAGKTAAEMAERVGKLQQWLVAVDRH